uniref:Ig-like domain-containing protein n=1 Tax=Neolamprologus brichardi TaxID=32507 RepID=A0A3Q4MSV8_NEOBR
DTLELNLIALQNQCQSIGSETDDSRKNRDTATLQCSVLTNSEKNTCSGHHNVFWFRDGSNKSLPNIIYTHGNRTDQCEQRSDPQDGCVYRFSKTVSSSDAGTYYCAVATCGEILFGNGTKLDVQGMQLSSNYIVVQKQMESNPVYSGDTATLECSVFSDSENKMCPGDQNVFWFRAGSHPNIIYTDRKRHEYENRSDPQKRCVYRSSKNVSSSDAGTHYCAVATCGEIISGNGTKLNIQGTLRISPMSPQTFVIAIKGSAEALLFTCSMGSWDIVHF